MSDRTPETAPTIRQRFYLHTTNGEPAYFDGTQLVKPFGHRAAPLCSSLDEIREQRAATVEFRQTEYGEPPERTQYGVVPVVLPAEKSDVPETPIEIWARRSDGKRYEVRPYKRRGWPDPRFRFVRSVSAKTWNKYALTLLETEYEKVEALPCADAERERDVAQAILQQAARGTPR